jgi:hypothetical protein
MKGSLTLQNYVRNLLLGWVVEKPLPNKKLRPNRA